MNTESNWHLLINEKINIREHLDIDGHTVPITNYEKELWPGITKLALIHYYHAISPFILPHLINRPLSLHIKNLSATKPGFYIKDMEGHQPPWATVFTTERKIKKAGKRHVIDYLVCTNEASLLYCINLGCIDLNPWNSTTRQPTQPGYIVIDLDQPEDKKEGFEYAAVIETARAAKKIIDRYRLTAFPKTSGKTGMHICIPCKGFSYPQARIIAHALCREIHLSLPGMTTIADSISQREGKLYVDPSQNDFADTIAAAYSVRPYHLPTVSTPLEWKEIRRTLDPRAFTIETMLKRVEKKGDLFLPVHDKNIAAANSRILASLLKSNTVVKG